MTRLIEQARAAAPVILKNTKIALRALYVGACVASYAAAMIWIATRRP